jgi:hypothetical protein
MNAIKKLLDAVEFSPGIYPYAVIVNPTAAAEALQELQDFAPLLDDLSLLLSEVRDTRNKLDEVMRLLSNEEKEFHIVVT